MYYVVSRLEVKHFSDDALTNIEELILHSSQEFTIPLATGMEKVLLARLDEEGGKPYIVDGQFVPCSIDSTTLNLDKLEMNMHFRESVFLEMKKYAILRLNCPYSPNQCSYMLIKKWKDNFYPIIIINPVKYDDGLYDISYDHSIHDTTRYTTRELFSVFFGFIRNKLTQPQ